MQWNFKLDLPLDRTDLNNQPRFKFIWNSWKKTQDGLFAEFGWVQKRTEQITSNELRSMCGDWKYIIVELSINGRMDSNLMRFRYVRGFFNESKHGFNDDYVSSYVRSIFWKKMEVEF